MKKLEALTPEQDVKKLEVRDYWNDYIFSCKNTEINKNAAKIGIDWLYESSKLKAPVVIYVDSPLGCQYATVYLKELANQGLTANVWDNVRANVWDNVRANVWANVRANVRDNVWANVWANVWDNVRANVRANVGDNVRANVWANVRANVRDNVWANVRANVGANVWANVRANVRDNVRANVGDNVWANVWANVRDNVWDNFESFASYGSINDYGWVSFFDFFTQIGVLNHDGFNQFKNVLLSGIYDMIQLNGFCIVSSLPVKINRDKENRLHSVTEYAIEFKDGYGQHYVHGFHLSPELFEKLSKKEITFKDFLTEPNEEIKSVILSFYSDRFGDEYLFRFLSEHLKEVDTHVDKKSEEYLTGTTGGMNVGVYTLFKGKISNISLAYVRCYCPSSDRMFFLGVEPVYNNAKDAIASLYRVPAKLKPHITAINRQGEVYSTNFTDTGLGLMNGFNDEDYQDLVSLNGNEYFSLLKYEY